LPQYSDIEGLSDITFSRNQPLKSADDYYINAGISWPLKKMGPIDSPESSVRK